jgi:hypothetical protein
MSAGVLCMSLFLPMAIQGASNNLDVSQKEEILCIPVAIHIVYNNPIQNISDAQIMSQITAINKDYSRTNTDASNTSQAFLSIAASTNIKFYLAKIDPAGHPTTGITRTNTSHGVFADKAIHSTIAGGIDGWNPKEYLNVWVCDLPPGIFGFASSPSSSDSLEDGVVIDFESFGTTGTAAVPYHLGRTMTHEVGHYLGLKHTWGIIGGCDDDDGIADTPIQDTLLTDCNVGHQSCGSTDMAQNFMNSAHDDCLNLFTIGQAAAMNQTIVNARSGLIENDKGYENIVTSIYQLSFDKLIAYPNPGTTGEFMIETNWPIDSFLLADQLGNQVPFELRATPTGWMIKVSKKGSFLLQTRVGDQSLATKLIHY